MNETKKEVLTFDEKLDKIISFLEDDELNLKVDRLFELSVAKKELITRYDIIKNFNIKITTFNQIQSLLRHPNTTLEQVEKIKYIVNKIASYDQAINMINDKSIKSGSRINKNTMSYLLKEEKEENDLVIINVSVNNEKENITIKKILNAK